MALQQLVVMMLVLGCGTYAAWTLMPAGGRRAIASRLLKWPLPARLQQPLLKAMKPAGACGGCDSCGDEKPAAPAGGAKPIHFHRQSTIKRAKQSA
jgi:hypothetical protein